jgi:hypothetical protein
MKRRLVTVFIITIWCSFNISYGQLITQTVRGNVSDKETNVALPGASVLVLETEPVIKTITDNNGNFKVTVPVGRCSISVNYMGYEEMVVSNIIVISGKETDLRISMREKFYTTEEVKVVAKKRKDIALNNMAAISARVLSPEDAVKYAGGFYDPARMVSSFAGVAAVEGDGVNDIVIRGNSPRGLLWRLEGIEIPNPNHFTDGQGSTGGAVGMITSNVLAMSDFLSGAFPAEYGNAYSGVMDISLRTGNMDKYEFGFQIGDVGIEASAEGPVLNINGSSFLVNYRYSTLGILGQAGLINLGNNNIPPIFQDLTFNIKIPTKNTGIFYFFGVGGMSNTGTEPASDSLKWGSYDDREYETEDHKMGVFAIKHTITLPNQKTFLRSIVALEGQQDKWNHGYLTNDYSRFQNYNDDFSYPTLRVAFQANHKFNRLMSFRTGFNCSFISFKMFAREFDFDQTVYDTIIDKTGSTSQYQIYGQLTRRLTNNLETGLGLHYMYFLLNDRSSFEPRASLKYSITDKQTLSFGFGIHTRAEAVAAYLAPVIDTNGFKYEANKKLDFTRAYHFVLGYDHLFRNDFRFKSEIYYQHLTRVPIDRRTGSMLSSLNASYGVPEIPFENEGKGYNYGLELTVEKFYTNNYYVLSTISLFDSKYQANNRKWYNTYFNSNYIFNLLGGKDFLIGRTKQNILGINSKFVYRGGFRYTPIDKEATATEGEIVLDYSKYNEEHAPDFIRFDIGLNFRRNNTGYSWIFSLDIQNILNRPNTLGFEEGDDELEPIVGQGLIPILNFRIEF